MQTVTSSDLQAASQFAEAFLRDGPKAPVKLSFSILEDAGLQLFDGAAAGPGNSGPAPEPPAELPFRLFKDEHDWEQIGIPLELCEFLAYKCGLAYEEGAAIQYNLEKCCRGIGNFAYFDSTKGEDAMPGVDTQGYGFVFEDKAFIILRGTSSTNDWRGNLTDQLTDGPDYEAARQRLMKKHGDVGPLLGELAPGRHLGFLLGWCAVRPQIEAWYNLYSAQLRRPIVFSGHSLGGALAFLGALDMARAPSSRRIAAVITFGAPKVGNEAFKKAYDALLGNRTVRVESLGDKVPEVARRSGYVHVGKLWEFEHSPPISRAAFLASIAATKAAIAKAEREKAEAKAGSKQPKKEQEPAASGETAPQSSQGSARLFFIVFGGMIAAIAAIFAAAFVKRALDSHNVQQRYANYLSTLAYQRIRALRGGDLARAGRDLTMHLRFIRGELPAAEKPIDSIATLYAALEQMPVRLEPGDDIKLFIESDKTHMV